MKGSSIETLLFRNGGIGLAELDQRSFLTLNSSKAISQMNLARQNPDYPSIPLQFTKKNLKIIQVHDGTCRKRHVSYRVSTMRSVPSNHTKFPSI